MNEFILIRKTKIQVLRDMKLTADDFEKEAIHSDLGPVKLKQLISTWVIHDLNHLAHMERAIAKHYLNEVGPWIEYLTILKN